MKLGVDTSYSSQSSRSDIFWGLMITIQGINQDFICFIHVVMICMEWDKATISIKFRGALNGTSGERMVCCSHTLAYSKNSIWIEAKCSIMKLVWHRWVWEWSENTLMHGSLLIYVSRECNSDPFSSSKDTFIHGTPRRASLIRESNVWEDNLSQPWICLRTFWLWLSQATCCDTFFWNCISSREQSFSFIMPFTFLQFWKKSGEPLLKAFRAYFHSTFLSF